MTIQSTDFGRAELFGEEAERFQRHMTEDKPNLAAKAPLALGEWPIPSRALAPVTGALWATPP